MSTEAAGIMEGAYFVSRKDILNWINDFLKVNLQKIEDTANGAYACQILDAIYPNSIPMSKVDFSCREDYEFLKNYKLLQSCFTKNGVTKLIDVEKLIRGKYQDNFEFMQWMKWFFDSHYTGGDYDAIGRRSRSKGGNEVTAKNIKGTTAKVGMTSSTVRHTTMPYKPTERSHVTPNTSYDGTPKITRVRESPRSTLSSSRSIHDTRSASAQDTTNMKLIEELQQKNEELTKQLEDMKKLLADEQVNGENLTNERDFYYIKLRDIESFILDFEEKNGGSIEITDQIKATLYADDQTPEEANQI
ncbi:hypothetical protein WA158_007511 [Blastocystis sp. Blastoise]